MPPITPQGSRAGLLTALVISIIAAIAAIIFAIYFNVQLKSVQESSGNKLKEYNDIVAESALTSPDVTGLTALKGDPASGYSEGTAFDIAIKQRNDLVQSITGSAPADATGIGTAIKSASDELAKTTAAGVKLPSEHDNLVGALQATTALVTSGQAQIKKLQDDLAAAQKGRTDSEAKVAAVTKEKDDQLAAARAADQAELQKVNDQYAARQSAIDDIKKLQDEDAKKAQDAAQAAQTQLAELNKQLDQAKADATKAQTKLAGLHIDASNAAVRQADGRIVRIPGSGICYINLGQGDHVTPGLTFEVYDKSEGVPGIPATATADEQLPQGKASIEITRVGTTSSECRIVRTSPGAVLTEGDVIANLVYDPNTKYNFFVYGKFDLAETGRPNDADAEVIKRLVTQWGGTVMDQVNVDTDFVVLGKEPELPSFSKEELDQPLNADKLAKAQAEVDKYHEIIQQARDLHIPVLNQNRFLYYVGYYDQAKR
jgi:hypothetical protein